MALSELVALVAFLVLGIALILVSAWIPARVGRRVARIETQIHDLRRLNEALVRECDRVAREKNAEISQLRAELALTTDALIFLSSNSQDLAESAGKVVP